MDLYVIDRDTAEVRSLLSNVGRATWHRRLYEVAPIELGLTMAQLDGSGLVTDESAVVVNDPTGPRAYLVEAIEVTENDSAGGSFPVRVTGRDFSLCLAERIVIPPGDQAQRKVTSVSVEEAMIHYVATAAGSDAASERAYPRFSEAASQGRGPTVTFGARYSVLIETLQDLAQLSGLGWEVVWDPADNTYRFQVIEGVERGLASAAPVVLDPDLETVAGMRWLSSVLGRKTHATTGGGDEGADRLIRERWIGDEEPTGFARREVFFDARDLGDDEDQLDARADARLAETVVPDRFEVRVNPQGWYRYPDHFDLGDLVVVRSARYGVSEDARVVGITRSSGTDSGAGSQVVTTIELGDRWPTLRTGIAGPAAANPNLGSTRT